MKAIGLLSGGLDSMLASKIVKDLGFEVIGLHFRTGFSIAEHRKRIKGEPLNEEQHPLLKIAQQIGIEMRIIDLRQTYLSMLLNPKFGYGKNFNPCIDCHILFLKYAGKIMKEEKAEFVFTGEVLGQRPMSQHMPTLKLIERESGLEGYLLRPLSALLLEPTIPEQKGIIDRSKLLALQGRSRRAQLALAETFGLKGFSAPGSVGCYLVDKNFTRRLKDLLSNREKPHLSMEDISILSAGRYLRISKNTFAIVGRFEKENAFLEQFSDRYIAMVVSQFPGPLTLVIGEPNDEELKIIAAITARYSDGKDQNSVEVKIKNNDQIREIEIVPMSDEIARKYVI